MGCCAICGWYILDRNDYPKAWASEFRGLYTCPDGIVLTGVGCFHDGRFDTFTAPPDPRARWDDPGYDEPDDDVFGVMRQGEVNDRRGFVFHDACWSLLAKVFHPAPIPLARLFEVCDSVPMLRCEDSVDWGHDYGGLFILNEKNFFPWEKSRVELGDFPDGEDEWLNGRYSAYPLASPTVGDILGDPPQAAPRDSLVLASAGPAASCSRDPFSSLPVELCLEIAEYLPMRDVMNVRCASRSFWHTFHSQYFWACRFRVGYERSWLFEARGWKTASRDWGSIYRRTVDARIGLELKNRKRIWGLIQHIIPLVDLCWNETLPEISNAGTQDWPAVAEESSGQEPECYRALGQGDRRVRSQRVAVPEGLSQVSTSTIRVGNSEYIAGISLTAASGQVLELGYRNASQSRSVQVSGLAGFNLAVGRDGIHALQCIDGQTLEPSTWLGCPDDAPRTSRLAVGARITALEVGFDAFRIVNIAQKSESTTSVDDLRHSAIWYPEIPSPTVSLNEEFYLPHKFSTRGYEPLFWSSFGGPGGIYLRHLTKVTASCLGPAIFRMDFSFDIEVPAASRQFGRRGDDKRGALVEFLVDGPGGEVIDKVEVWHRFSSDDAIGSAGFHGEGQLGTVKLSTNRGRTAEFGSNRGRGRRTAKTMKVTREVVAAPGTAITGFFGFQCAYLYSRARFGALGVITEPLRGTD